MVAGRRRRLVLTVGSAYIGTDGFIATFPLNTSIVGNPSNTQPYGDGRTLVANEIELVHGSSGENILGDCTVSFGSDSVTVRYDASTPMVTGGVYRVDLQLCYNGPGVTDLLSVGWADFSVGGSIPDYSVSMAFSGLTLLSGGDDFCEGKVVFSYDETPGYSYDTTVTGLTVEWTDITGNPTQTTLSTGSYTISGPVIGSGTQTHEFSISRSIVPSNAVSFRIMAAGEVAGTGHPTAGDYEDTPSVWSASVELPSSPTPVNPIDGGSFSYTPTSFSGELNLIDDFNEEEFELRSSNIVVKMTPPGEDEQDVSMDLTWWVSDGILFVEASPSSIPDMNTDATYRVYIDCTYMDTSFHGGPYSVTLMY